MGAPGTDWFANVEDRPHPPPGLTWLTAALVYDDVGAAMDFYARALGLVAIFELPGEVGTPLFARMRHRGGHFTLNRSGFDPRLRPPDAARPTPFAFYLYVDDLRAAVAAMEAAGAVVAIAPRAEPWGDLRARLGDPFGYVWDLAQRSTDGA